MKKQLNLICVLIFFFVGLSLVPSIYSMGNAFVDGFKEGMSQAKEAHEQGTTYISAEVLSPLALNLWPKSLAATSDKLFNQKDQEWYPASHIKALVWAKSKDVGIARYVSFLVLISFVMTQTYTLMNYWAAIRLFELEGYEHNFWCDFQSMTLIMGLIALLVGRIFAIGLQMKEEQELTI